MLIGIDGSPASAEGATGGPGGALFDALAAGAVTAGT
jgi:hypothetical protein